MEIWVLRKLPNIQQSLTNISRGVNLALFFNSGYVFTSFLVDSCLMMCLILHIAFMYVCHKGIDPTNQSKQIFLVT